MFDFNPTTRLMFCGDQPVMWRRPGTVQFGTGEHSIVIDQITSTDVRWLTGLDGMRPWAEINACGITDPQRRLLEASLAAGAITDTSNVPSSWRLIPIEHRTQRDGDLSACRLTYRNIDRTVNAIEQRLTLRLRVVGSGPLHDACIALVEHNGFTIAEEEPDLVIIAGGFHPDAAFAHPALQSPAVALRPHLAIGAYGDFGVIGPLVIPGRTSCLMCHQLHARDGDPAWPVLVTQRIALAGAITRWPIDGVHAAALASHALLFIRTWRENPDASHLWANRARCIWLPDGSVDDLARPMHPTCGCTWSPLSATGTDT